MVKPLKGIVPPMITPMTGKDEVDIGGLERLIEHILDGGVHGLFILGSTGEAPDLSYRMRYELVERVCRQVAGRVPVLVGITDTSFVEAVNLACHSDKCGADAVVVAPPYYFPAGQPELLEYVEHLVDQLPLDVFLYNMPSYTKLFFEPATVKAAAEYSRVIGLKDSSANMIYLHDLIHNFADRPDFTLLTGPEELLVESVFLGGHGGVCGGANMFPNLYVKAYEAAISGDLEMARKLHKTIMLIRQTIYNVGRYSSSFLKGVKCVLSCMGICDDYMSEPFHRFRKEERLRIQSILEELILPKL